MIGIARDVRAPSKRTKTVWACFLLLLVGSALPTPVDAQVALDQFRPAPLASDGFALSRPEVLRKHTWGVLAMIDYANDPLVLNLARSDRQISVVKDHLVLHVAAAVALGARLTAFATLPVHLVMQGDDPGQFGDQADGAGLGDVAFGGRFRLAGGATRAGTLSAEFIARVPTASLANSDQVYSGDKIGSYEPVLVGELHMGRFDLRLRGGVRLRKEVQIGDLTLGQEIVYGLGARLRVVRGLYAHAELYGASNMSALSDREHTPLELLLGMKYQASDWLFGAAAGPGLVQGYGAPDVRLVGMVGYAPVERVVSPPPPPPVVPDTDGDGLLDPNDGCPTEPEDKDDFADEDGCPDPDNDQDGVLDVDDSCPLEPEDKDGFEDENGCPDPDNDQDGILDVEDACPLVPGVIEARGCPKPKEIAIENGKLMILDRVEFAVNKDVILESSEELLGKVQRTLTESPELKQVRIEGHTDNVGKDARNLDLSKRRARSVARWLIEHGVAAERLESWGCGENRPLGANGTAEERQANRRVEFHIADPAPEMPRSTEGCVQIPLQ
jgi:large repetitive protein